MHTYDLSEGKEFYLGHGFKVFTGALYLVGFIGDNESKRECPKYTTSKWEKNIRTITKTAGKYPQESYAAVVRVIQSEWIFLHHVKKDMGYVFLRVEKILQETFLPHILFGKPKTSPTYCRNLKYDDGQEIWPRPTRSGEIS